MTLANAGDIPLRLAVANDDDLRAVHANFPNRFLVSLMLGCQMIRDSNQLAMVG
jgi:hypothetical protein